MKIWSISTSALLLLCASAWSAETADERARLSIKPLDTQRAATPFTITGTVSDVSGNPLPGVAVRWWEQERPEGLRDVNAVPPAFSGADGGFRLELPSQHVRYYINLARPGYEEVERGIFGPETSLELAMAPLPPGEGLHGTVTREGRPAQATVYLLYGDGRKAQGFETNADGSFRIPATAGDWTRPPVYAESDGLFSPLRGAGMSEEGVELKLGAPGSLDGILVAEKTEEPIAGCTVEIMIMAHTASIRTLTTDEEGRFVANALPPGGYHLNMDHAGYGEPTGISFRRNFSVDAGETTKYRGTLLPKATVSGVVTGDQGAPVAGAWVGFEATISWGPYGRLAAVPTGPVRTDESGRFHLRTSHTEQTRTLKAYHPTGGRTEVDVHIPGPGEETREVSLALPGAIRVLGSVKNTKGDPVPNVVLGEMETDAQGKFDSGFVVMPPLEKGVVELDFIAPRPAHGMPIPGVQLPREAVDHELFLHQTVALEPHRGQEIVLDVTLQPTRAITFGGTVTDPDGNAVPGVRVALMYGDPAETPGRAKYRRGLSILRSLRRNGMRSVKPPFTGAISDNSGAWSLALPVETAKSLRSAYSQWLSPARVFARAELPERGLAETLPVGNLSTLPADAALDIALAHVAPETMGHFRVEVVDPEGKPLEGIEWTWGDGQSDATLRTDTEGMILLPPKWKYAAIVLQDDRWSVMSPEKGDAGVKYGMVAAGEAPYRIVLGEKGSFAVHAHYPNGEAVEVDGAVKGQRKKVRWLADSGGFVAEDIAAGRQTIIVDTSDGYYREFEVDVPAGGQGEMRIEIPRPTCTIKGQLTYRGGDRFSEVEVHMRGKDFADYARVQDDGSFMYRVPPGAYVLEVTRKHIPCLVRSSLPIRADFSCKYLCFRGLCRSF